MMVIPLTSCRWNVNFFPTEYFESEVVTREREGPKWSRNDNHYIEIANGVPGAEPLRL